MNYFKPTTLPIACLYRYFSIVSVVLLFSISTPCKTLRHSGVFQLAETPDSRTSDPYNGSVILRNHSSHRKIRVRITVNDQFSRSSFNIPGVVILNNCRDTWLLDCTLEAFKKIRVIPGVTYCAISRSVSPLLDSSRSQSELNVVQSDDFAPLPFSCTGKGVLTGILDTEFDIYHSAFLDSNGQTRFIALWDQQDSSGAANNTFGYGTIKTGSSLHTDSTFGLSQGNHGTHTASTMAGSFNSAGYTGAAPDAIIAAVRYSGTEEIADGISWIFSIADSLNIPCVINLSLGVANGPHDGTSPIDRAIDSLSGAGKIVVGAIGNDGAIPSHIRFDITPEDTARTWVLPVTDSLPGDSVTAFSGIDIWGTPSEHFSVSLQILDRPTGKYIESSNSISTIRSRSSDVDSIVWNDSIVGTMKMYYTFSSERSSSTNEKPHCVIFTRTFTPRLVLGITIRNVNNTSTTVHCWNYTHKSLNSLGIPGFKTGDTLYTVNEIGGTSKRSITVGGYVSRVSLPLWSGTLDTYDWLKNGDAFYSSSLGPTVDGRNKPDITAPAWCVVAAISRTVPRTYNDVALWPDTLNTLNRYGGQTGTSMSSPFVAGIVALMLQLNKNLTPEKVRAILQKSANNDAFTGPLGTPSNKWGSGKINAYAALLTTLDIPVSAPKPLIHTTTHSIELRGNIIHIKGFDALATFALYSLQGECILKKHLVNINKITLPETIAHGFYLGRLLDVKGKYIATALLPLFNYK